MLAVNLQGNVNGNSSQIRAPLLFTDVNAVREQLRLLNSTTNVTGITIEVDLTTGTCHLYIVHSSPNSQSSMLWTRCCLDASIIVIVVLTMVIGFYAPVLYSMWQSSVRGWRVLRGRTVCGCRAMPA